MKSGKVHLEILGTWIGDLEIAPLLLFLNMLEEARVFDPPKLTSFACVGPQPFNTCYSSSISTNALMKISRGALPY